MNHSASRDCARTSSSVESAARTTLMTPSAPSPACRSAMRCTWAGVSSSEPSRSGTRTKSFSVPWPLVKRVMSVILRYAVAHPRIRLTNCREGSVEQVRARGVEPLDAGVGPEPRLLPAGVAASRLSRVAARRGLVEGAVDDGDGLAVADGPTRGDTVAQTYGEEGLGLATQPRLPHALDTPLDAFHEDVTVDAEAQDNCRRDELTRGHRRTERAAGELDDLEGPDHPSAVAGQDSGGSPWVESEQPRVHRVTTDHLGLGLEAPAHGGVGGRDLEPVEGGSDVEARPADEERPVASPADRGDVGAGCRLVAGDAGLLGHVEDVELVVGDAAPLGGGQLGRADVHAAVELHGVGVDDLTTEPRGEVEGQVGLARRRRPDDGDHRSGDRRRAVRRHDGPDASRSWLSRGEGSADEVVGVLVNLVLVVTERVLVDAWVPRAAGLAPAVALDGLAGLLGLAVVETVDVEGAVEVVVLVLHAPREPSGRVELDAVAVDVEADDVGAVGPLEGEGLAGHRETALGLLVGVRALLRDLRGGDGGVDDVPLLGHAVLVGHLPDEHPQPDPDLGCREPDAVGRDVRLVHVLDEGAELVVEVRDEGGGPVQDGLTGDDDGAHTHAPSQARGDALTRIGSDDRAARRHRGDGRSTDGRHAEAHGRLAGALRRVLERRPGVTPGGAPDGIRPALEARVGHEVVRRAVRDLHGDHVAGAGHLRALGNGEVDEPVVAGPP